MNKIQLLFILSKTKNPFKLRMRGSSMGPILHDGDTIVVCQKDGYSVGDILVYRYKENELLIHRLLKIEGDRYFCKGDSAFRLEDISQEQIIGAVITKNDSNNNAEFVKASLGINGIFRKCGYNLETAKKTPEYLDYERKYLEAGNEIQNN
jgi:signal peptidase